MDINIYEITPCPQGRLAIMARPRGDEWLRDELESLKSHGVSDVVSMLTHSEETELELGNESDLCTSIGLRFHRHSVQDRSLPIQPSFDHFISSLLPVMNRHGFIAIHCRAGIGRSSIVAAAILCRLGISAPDALALISKSRRIEIPDTQEQREFILNLNNSRKFDF